MTKKVVPIDPGNAYRTRDGHDVEIRGVVKNNSAGNRVTYPVKGSILHKTSTGRVRREYAIWTLAGRFMSGKNHKNDLIEVKDHETDD
jgi:hypothetical protein